MVGHVEKAEPVEHGSAAEAAARRRHPATRPWTPDWARMVEQAGARRGIDGGGCSISLVASLAQARVELDQGDPR